MKDFTGFYDDNNKPIYEGDILKGEYGYKVIVTKFTLNEDNLFYGKLICDENHPMVDMFFSLVNGKGYTIVNQ